MRKFFLLGVAFFLLAGTPYINEGWAQSEVGSTSQGGLTTGITLWRNDTAVEVQSATEFDGSDDTIDQKLRDWETKGSGVGLRVGYEFPVIVSVYGEIGLNQTTVREKDFLDPAQDVSTLGLDEGFFFSFGGRAWSTFTSESPFFWSGGISFGVLSSNLDEDINVTWSYDQTDIMLHGRVGVLWRDIGFFGGLRYASLSADLEETDRTNLPGFQTRRWEFDRDSPLDMLLGAETVGGWIHGQVQVEIGGTVGASMGLSMGI